MRRPKRRDRCGSAARTRGTGLVRGTPRKCGAPSRRPRRRWERTWKGGCPGTSRLPSMRCPMPSPRFHYERVEDSLGSRGTAPLAATLVQVGSDEEDFVSDSSDNSGAEQPEGPAADEGVTAGQETWPASAAAVGEGTRDFGRASEDDAYAPAGYGQSGHADQTY